MDLADRIREAMGKMKRAEFASAVGVSNASVTFWLDGKTKSLKAETASQMERVTGYRAGWIVNGKGPKRVRDLEAPAEVVWPFRRVAIELVTALVPEDLAYVEGRLAEALDAVDPDPPNEEDLAAFAAAHQSKAKRTKRKRAA